MTELTGEIIKKISAVFGKENPKPQEWIIDYNWVPTPIPENQMRNVGTWVKVGENFMFPYFTFDGSGRLTSLENRSLGERYWSDGIIKISVYNPRDWQK